MWFDQRGSEILDQATCLALLADAPDAVGRIGFQTGDMPTVLPVNFVLDGHDICFRTGPGTKSLAGQSMVAFEVDHVDRAAGVAWSVLVRGIASAVPDDAVASLPVSTPPLVPEPADRWMRVRTSVITGRRFPVAPTATGAPAPGS